VRHHGGGKKVSIIDGPHQAWKIMTEDSDKFCGVPGCVPSGEGFGVDWCKLMNFIRATVWDAMSGIADGSDEGD
jgi:hypothetical protein